VTKLSFAAVAALTVLATGCARSGSMAAGPRESAPDGVELLASIEALEERLIADQARVWFWTELRERHGEVAAVACTNMSEHAIAMARADERHQAQLADQKRRRRVAMAATTPMPQ
jgi:hypothetical protein